MKKSRCVLWAGKYSNVHAHVYGGVILIFNMVAIVAKFGWISAEFEGKVTTTRIMTQV